MTDSIRFAWRRMVNRDHTLSHATLRVLLELESYTDADCTNARPGVSSLAQHVRNSNGKPLSENMIACALAIGCERGWIERTEQGHLGGSRSHADVYRLTFPQDVSSGLDDTPDCGDHATPRDISTQTATCTSEVE
ncbi:hypothetical protein [Prescottella equi]|uniref:hypothetical protein n=1 Tax=Rhodococcus hoagii TaxID=43767 RepID=UPI001C753D27|nr:hypothetical protein [Prescottella equi]BCN44691.1 hypothetical protein RE9414_29710 [Prescottella equi]